MSMLWVHRGQFKREREIVALSYDEFPKTQDVEYCQNTMPYGSKISYLSLVLFSTFLNNDICMYV